MEHVHAVLEALPPEVGEQVGDINIDGEFRRAIEKLYDADMAKSLPLKLKNGKEFTWCVARPQAVVRSLTQISPALRRAIANVPSSYNTQWHIIFYLDEITPGNIAAPMNSRKFVAIYYTFRELGHLLVRSQDCWFHFGVLRTSILKDVVGGYGALMKAVIHTFISDVESFHEVGIAVDVGDGPCLLYAKPWRLLADGAALSATFDSTGAAGTKVCFCCANAIKDGTFDVASDTFVPITCGDPKKFIRHTNESVWKSFDDLAAMAPAVKPTPMKKLAQCYGFKYNPDGMLMDKKLRDLVRPVDFYTQDWAHIFLQHGVGNVEFYHLHSRIGVDIEELRAYASTWSLPAFRRHLQKGAKQVFTVNRRETKEQYWKASISEFLTVAPMILNFILTAVRGYSAEIALFTKLCSILDLIRAMKRGHMHLVGKFRKQVLEHFQVTLRVYGSGIILPKHHAAAMHLADQYEDDEMVLDTMPVERLHQVPKGFGTVIKNLDAFEKSVLARLIAHQRHHSKDFDDQTRLLGNKDVGAEFSLSKSMYAQGLTITMGDVVLLQSKPLDVGAEAGAKEIAVVAFCGQAGDVFFLVCSVCDVMEQRRGAAIVRHDSSDLSSEREIWLSDTSVEDVKAWRRLDNEYLEVLLPLV